MPVGAVSLNGLSPTDMVCSTKIVQTTNELIVFGQVSASMKKMSINGQSALGSLGVEERDSSRQLFVGDVDLPEGLFVYIPPSF